MAADWSLNNAQRVVISESARRIREVTKNIVSLMEAQGCRQQFDRPIAHLRESGEALTELIEWADKH